VFTLDAIREIKVRRKDDEAKQDSPAPLRSAALTGDGSGTEDLSGKTLVAGTALKHRPRWMKGKTFFSKY